MKTLGVLLMSLVLGSSMSLNAQGRGNNRRDQIPPGQMPRPGQCRVWYEGVPPGRQPAATDCRTAERIAGRERNARVIYGGDYDSRTGQRNPRAVQRPGPTWDSNRRYNDPAFDTGFRDGLEKGREDVRDNDVYDPARHSRYRSADRGYSNNYGSKDAYKGQYRQGFIEGYEQAYDGRFGQNRSGRFFGSND